MLRVDQSLMVDAIKGSVVIVNEVLPDSMGQYTCQRNRPTLNMKPHAEHENFRM
jgi:hypothetical protein